MCGEGLDSSDFNDEDVGFVSSDLRPNGEGFKPPDFCGSIVDFDSSGFGT